MDGFVWLVQDIFRAQRRRFQFGCEALIGGRRQKMKELVSRTLRGRRHARLYYVVSRLVESLW
jgi:hypothetical protein